MSSNETFTTLGQQLQQASAELARRWRSEGFVDARERPTASLDGVVEGLIFELGRSLESPSAGEAWSRARGVLLHSASRSELVLHREFRRLALLLDRAAREGGAGDLERVRLRHLLVAAHKQALEELRGQPVRQAGVTVELFEGRRREVVRPVAA